MTPTEALARATGTLALIADGRGPAREMAQAALDAIEQAAEAEDSSLGLRPSAAADLDVEALAAAFHGFECNARQPHDSRRLFPKTGQRCTEFAAYAAAKREVGG